MPKQVWANHLKQASSANISFCAGRDLKTIKMADEELLPFDLWTNYAHCQMLHKQKIISLTEWKELQKHFKALLKDFKSGKFKLNPALEDVHINIESYLSEQKNCAASRKIHTARSRNDQVTTTTRLYLRNELIFFTKQIIALTYSIINKASLEIETIMPGFSHYQPAMPTTLAHWMSSWSQALLRSIKNLTNDLLEMNSSPLGAAAGFGTTWNIDRKYSASIMAFTEIQENSLDCISSRGEWEGRLAAHCSLLMNQISTLSQDLILLSQPYFGMLKIDEAFVTGSSIMPQKKNPDFAEVIRAKTAVTHGITQSLFGIAKAAMSGYNRDTQQTKYLIMDLFYEIKNIPKILQGVIETFIPQKERMKQLANQNHIYSTDLTDYLACYHKMAFRDSYNLVALAVSSAKNKISYEDLKLAAKKLKIKFTVLPKELDAFLNDSNPINLLKKKSHLGGPSPKSVKQMLQKQKASLQKTKLMVENLEKKVLAAYNKCFG